MRVFWWQAGLHLEPESDRDRTALLRLQEALEGLGLVRLVHGVDSDPVVVPKDDEPVIAVHVLV